MIIGNTFKASYTVEATVVISLCMILFGAAVMVCFEVFKDTIDYVSHEPDTFDSVSLFRIKEGLVGIFNAIRD